MRGAGGVGDVAFARGLCGGAADIIDIIDIIDRIDSGGVRRGARSPFSWAWERGCRPCRGGDFMLC